MRCMASVGVVGLWLVYFVPTARGSDPVGVYAVLERVEFEPNAAQPERVKLFGWFAMSDVSSREYKEPQHGWLCYTLPQEKKDLCRREWKDMEGVAGSGKCLAFGVRRRELGKVAEEKEKASPVEYTLASGLFAIRSDTDYDVIQNLVTIPLAASPAPDSLEAAGPVTLKAINPRGRAHPTCKLVFDLVELSTGAREKSKPIAAGETETTWSPEMRLKPGQRYSWQVEAIDGDWKSRSAGTEFQVKAAS
ncbi:MAG TPA: hypothetical protein VG826_19160 [Pirellulales bacterium]|nr:hypothetical protein [Pirellulales bacterium]